MKNMGSNREFPKTAHEEHMGILHDSTIFLNIVHQGFNFFYGIYLHGTMENVLLSYCNEERLAIYGTWDFDMY